MYRNAKKQNLLILFGVTIFLSGCAKHQQRPSITAVGLSPGNRCDPPGIPYYLPKPLLVVSKNVRHVEESKVGLTGPAPIPNGFDNQAAYADIKSNVTIPQAKGQTAGLQAAEVANAVLSNAAPGQPTEQAFVASSMIPTGADGLQPDSFFTYQIIFVPDLSQKYGLEISGGAGEFRAAMNMVNGWMFTGLGPFYFKDSSSAQNAMATGVAALYAGRGVSDVVESVGDLASTLSRAGGEGADQKLQESEMRELRKAVEHLALASQSAPRVPKTLLNFAEVYIYEPVLLADQSTDWRLVAEHRFDRDYLETVDSAALANKRLDIMKTLLSKSSTSSSTEGANKSDQQGSNEGADKTESRRDEGIDLLQPKETTESGKGGEANDVNIHLLPPPPPPEHSSRTFTPLKTLLDCHPKDSTIRTSLGGQTFDIKNNRQ